MGPRPAALVVLGVIGLVWAGLGLLMGATGMVIHVIYWPTAATLQAQLGYEVVMLLGLALRIVFGIWLLIAATGLMRLRAWSPKALRGYAWADLAAIVLMEALTVAFIVLPTIAEYNAAPVGIRWTPLGLPGGINWVMWGGVVARMLVSPIMPVLVLVMLRRQSIKDALAGTFGLGGRFEVVREEHATSTDSLNG